MLNALQVIGRSRSDDELRVAKGGLGITNMLNDPAMVAKLQAGDRAGVIADLQRWYHMNPDEAADVYETGVAMLGGRTLDEAKAIAAELTTLAGSDGILSPEDFDKLITQRKEDLTRLNSGNETEMLELQTIAQQRGQIIQMTSNMLRNIDEERDAVIGNLR
jgi:hypothetical protein